LEWARHLIISRERYDQHLRGCSVGGLSGRSALQASLDGWLTGILSAILFF
jgi:hypothetical protein